MQIKNIFSTLSPTNRFTSPEQINPPSTALHIGHLPLQDTQAEDVNHPVSEKILIEKIYGSSPSSSTQGASIKKVAEFFKNVRTSSHIDQHYKDFYINLAVLNHSLKQLPKREMSLRTRIAARILNYAYKFSTNHYLTTIQYASNPIQRIDWTEEKYEGGYHRFDDTHLKKEFCRALAKLLQIPEQNIEPVTSKGIHSLIKRNYVLHNNFDVCKWEDGGLIDFSSKQTQKSSVPFSSKFPNITEAMLQIMSMDKRCLYFDISDNLERLSQHPIHPKEAGLYIQTFQTYLRDVIEYGVMEKIKTEPQCMQNEIEEERNAYMNSRLREVMAHVDKNVMIGGMLKVGNQYVLYNGKLVDPEMSSHPSPSVAMEPITRNELKRMRFKRPPGLKPLQQEDKNHQKTAGIHGGFVSPPLLIMENWFQFKGEITPIFHALGIEKENTLQLPPQEEIPPLPFFKSFTAFLEHDAVQAFKELPLLSNAPYLNILPKITLKLIDALKDMNVDKAFDDAKLNALLQFSYSRILCGMQNAVSEKENISDFLNQNNLIHEEIATLLAVLKPYKKADFNNLMQKITQNNQKQHGMTPVSYFKNSGMSCMQSALNACEHRKRVLNGGGSGKLEIGLIKNNYFENPIISSYGSLHTISQVDSEDVQEKKLDMYIGHFHPSFSLDATTYHSEDMISHVDALYEKKQVLEHLLVVIDNTIGMSNEEKMVEFLMHNKSKIDSGKMSVVDIRSMQKFDQSGMDMYAGGLVAVYSRSLPLQQAFAAEDEETLFSQTNLQGMVHFAKTVQPELDERRAAIMKIARRFTTPGDPIGFPGSMYASETSDEPLQIMPNSDPHVPFFHIRLNNRFIAEMGLIMAEHLARKGARDPERFPLVFRESFGFNRTTCTNIDNHIRINPGLEHEEYFKKYRDYLVLLNNVLSEAIKKFPEKKEAVIANILQHGDQLIELIEKCANDNNFSALPETRKKLEDAWEQVIFPAHFKEVVAL